MYIPSCLDAALNEAWAVPPDPTLPWGMTRHLETGAPCWIELLIEVAEVLTERPVAERVLGRDSTRIERVGAIGPNYRIGREDLP